MPASAPQRKGATQRADLRLEARQRAVLSGHALLPPIWHAGAGEAAAAEALLVERKRALWRRGDAARAGRLHCGAAVAAAVVEGRERADDVERAGVAVAERLEEDVGLALLVVVVVQQALRHDEHLAGVDVERDVLRRAILLRDACAHLACTHRVATSVLAKLVCDVALQRHGMHPSACDGAEGVSHMLDTASNSTVAHTAPSGNLQAHVVQIAASG